MEELYSDAFSEFKRLKMNLISQGKMLLDLSMINPDQAPSRYLIDKLLEASLKSQHHRYSVSRGIRKLREAFAYKYSDKFNVHVNPETQVCVSSGTKDALHHLFLALKGKINRVIVGVPTYPPYLWTARASGMDLDFFQLSYNEDSMLTEIEEKLKICASQAILLNFPNNPTGIQVSQEFYRALGEVADRYNALLINDFVYGEMGFSGSPISLLSEQSCLFRGVEVYSLSKAYNVPGWRISAVVGNESLITELSSMKSKLDYGSFMPLQIAASAALCSREDLVEHTLREYSERCKIMCFGLQELGWEVTMPQAGVVLWAKPPQGICELAYNDGKNGSPKQSNETKSFQLATFLLKHAGIVTMPGVLFGECGDYFLRFAMVASREKLQEGVRKIKSLLRDVRFNFESKNILDERLPL